MGDATASLHLYLDSSDALQSTTETGHWVKEIAIATLVDITTKRK